MSQITPALISAFKRAHDEDLHAPMTIGEEKQLIHAWESLAASKQREVELVAHVERLREALESMPLGYQLSRHDDVVVNARAAIKATPAQSLAHLRNEVLEEAAGVADEHGAYLSAKAIRAMKEPT